MLIVVAPIGTATNSNVCHTAMPNAAKTPYEIAASVANDGDGNFTRDWMRLMVFERCLTFDLSGPP